MYIPIECEGCRDERYAKVNKCDSNYVDNYL